MGLLSNTPTLQIGRGLLEITSATFDELVELHLTTCARFDKRNIDGLGTIFRAKGFTDFINRQRSQYQTLWSDRDDYMKSAAKIIRKAIAQANELWSNPLACTSLTTSTAEPSSAGTAATTSTTLTPSTKEESNFEQPTFVLFEDRSGGHRFRLMCPKGTELLTSEAYKSIKGARGGIEVVRRNANCEQRFERIETDSGLPMFNLKAGNHQVVGTSVPYQSSPEMETALAMVQSASATAPVAPIINEVGG